MFIKNDDEGLYIKTILWYACYTAYYQIIIIVIYRKYQMSVEVADNVIFPGIHKLSATSSQHKLDHKTIQDGQATNDMGFNGNASWKKICKS